MKPHSRYAATSLFLILVSCNSPGLSYQILDLGVSPSRTGTVVTINADGSIQDRVFSLAAPDRIVVDCLGATHILPVGTYNLGRGGISRITTSQLAAEGGTARTVIELAGLSSHSLQRAGTRLNVLLASNGSDPFPSWAASQTRATADPDASGSAALPVSGRKSSSVGLMTPQGSDRGPSSPPKVRAGPPVSLDLEEADVLTVLRALSEYGGRNIVVASDVKGSVTVRLHNVPWFQALDEILKISGLSYVEEDGVIRIAAPAKLKSEEEEKLKGEKAIELLQPMVTKVYKLEFATAGEMKTPLTKMLSEKGTIEVEARTNSLVITDIGSKQKQVAELVSLLDSSTPQVEITARIIEANLDAARHIGVTWNAKNIQSIGITGADIGVAAPPSETGIGTFNIGTIYSWANLDASIEAMEREAKGKALANPRIMATNNKEAEIFAGKKIPISTRDQAGNVIAQYIEAGIDMKIVPHINSLEDITLDLTGEVSEPDLANLVQGLPMITTNKAQTRVLLRDGATVVLGGLKKTNEMESERGVPILRSIPFLGALFKSHGTTREDREILIFVTPHLVRPIARAGE